MVSEVEANKFPCYGTLDLGFVNKRILEVKAIAVDALKKIGVAEDGLRSSRNVLADIVTLIEKRRVYFHIYHNMDMGELIESALLCFWVLKLHPFAHIDIKNYGNIGAKIAASLFFSAVTYHTKKTGRKRRFFDKNNGHDIKMLKNLTHAFLYHDLSKESIIAMAEIFAL